MLEIECRKQQDNDEEHGEENSVLNKRNIADL